MKKHKEQAFLPVGGDREVIASRAAREERGFLPGLFSPTARDSRKPGAQASFAHFFTRPVPAKPPVEPQQRFFAQQGLFGETRRDE